MHYTPTHILVLVCLPDYVHLSIHAGRQCNAVAARCAQEISRMSAPGTSNKKDNAAPQKVGRPTNNMWALKTPQVAYCLFKRACFVCSYLDTNVPTSHAQYMQGHKMGSSLAVIQSRQAYMSMYEDTYFSSSGHIL
jgi:hypothetical protein